MSNLRIGRVAPQNPTGLTPVQGYNKPASQTLGNLFDGEALKQKLGLTDAAQKPVAQAATNPTSQRMPQHIFEGYSLKEAEEAAKRKREMDAAWEMHETANPTAREIAQYEQSAPKIKNPDVPIVRKRPQPQVVKPDAEAIVSSRTIQPKQSMQEFIDAREGIGRPVVDAQQSAGTFIKADIEKQLAQKPAMGMQEFIDAREGIGRTAKSAEESAKVFAENGFGPVAKAEQVIAAETVPAQMGVQDFINARERIGNVPKSASESFEVFSQAGMTEAKGAAEAGEKTGFFKRLGNKIKGAFKGVTNWFKGLPKAGKIGCIAAAAALLAAGIYGLYKLCSGKKEDAAKPQIDNSYQPQVPEKPTKPEEATPVTPTKPEEESKPEEATPVAPTKPEEETKPEEATPVAPTKPEEETKPEEATPVEPTEPEEPAKPEEDKNVHTVVYGDTVWDIAKAHLIELHKDEENYKPTNAEILKHTYEIMDYNPQLHWEPDHYHVMIRPGDKISLVKVEK